SSCKGPRFPASNYSSLVASTAPWRPSMASTGCPTSSWWAKMAASLTARCKSTTWQPRCARRCNLRNHSRTNRARWQQRGPVFVLFHIKASRHQRANAMKVKITYLQMVARPQRVVPPPRDGLAVVHAKAPTVAYYRFLYDAVGRDYDWTSRKKLADAELAA